MASLVEWGKYGAINTTDTAKNGFYVIIFTSEAYKLQDNTTIDEKIITAGKLVVKAQYLSSLQGDTNWCWNQHPQQNIIIVPTRTIIHAQLEVNSLTYLHDIPKSVCNRKQEKKIHIKTSYMFEWLWLQLHIKINWSSRQNWVWKRCISLELWRRKLI